MYKCTNHAVQTQVSKYLQLYAHE